MTKIVFFRSGGTYYGFEEQGHTGYAEAGEDILCSALSAMTMLIINAIEVAYSSSVDYTIEEANWGTMSENGLLTTVAWRLNGKPTYALEGSVFIGGAVVQWLRDEMQMIKTSAESESVAMSVPDNGNVYLVPSFTGLGAPHWDMYARGAIVGLTRGANAAHICRSVLEAIAYQMTDLLEAMKQDSDIELSELRVDGGASVSDIMMQIQSDMIRTNVNRPKMVETTAIGAAYLAGLAVGFWKDTEEIEKIREVDKIFEPKMDMEKREKRYRGWLRAVERSRDWVEH